MYEIEYQDGRTRVIATNIIAENLFFLVNKEGRQDAVRDQIIDLRRIKQMYQKKNYSW